MNSFILTLIRHGETQENVQGIIQGQKDTKLNESGVAQAKLLGEVFPIDEYDLVYSSDLSRAYDTCTALFKHSKRDLDIIKTDQRLRERSFGSMQGQSLSKLFALAREAKEEISHFTPSDGETAAQARERAIGFVESTLLQEMNRTNATKALIVSHGGVIREIISYFKSFLHQTFVGPTFNNREFGRIPPNTSVNTFKIFYDSFTFKIHSVECLVLHEISHMSEELQDQALSQKQVNNLNGPGV